MEGGLEGWGMCAVGLGLVGEVVGVGLVGMVIGLARCEVRGGMCSRY